MHRSFVRRQYLCEYVRPYLSIQVRSITVWYLSGIEYKMVGQFTHVTLTHTTSPTRFSKFNCTFEHAFFSSITPGFVSTSNGRLTINNCGSWIEPLPLSIPTRRMLKAFRYNTTRCSSDMIEPRVRSKVFTPTDVSLSYIYREASLVSRFPDESSIKWVLYKR